MQEVMVRLLICSATMSVLALFYMAAVPILAKYYSAKGCYYTWLVIVIGMIIPIRPQFNNAIVKVNMSNNMAAPVIQMGNKAAVTNLMNNTTLSVISDLSWWQITVMVWLAGMILFLTYHVIKYYRYLKLVTRWSENTTDEETLALLQNLKTQMGLFQKIGLQYCDGIGSPMMIGFVNARILLPKAEFTKAELNFILKHELVHYKRKDLWYKCLVLIAVAIHWFNPIIYWMAKAIDIQCELSCDEEVVRCTGPDIRQYYSQTIIGVVRYQSKLKTALSTNFYGGKKGMKRRIFSIMDMRKKKAGLIMLCGIMALTLGTGYAFAAKSETQGVTEMIREDIKENIKISPNDSFAYKFLPDSTIYSNYSSYGIEISDDGEMLLYKGERVRQFVDEHSDVQAFFLDGEGVLDLSVIRNAVGDITDIESISEDMAQEYRSAFFADDVSAAANSQDVPSNKYEQYSAYGIKTSSDGEDLLYNGQRVKLFADRLSDGSFEALWTDKTGTMNVSVVRNSMGKITEIESISEEQAQEFRAAADQYEQTILMELDE